MYPSVKQGRLCGQRYIGIRSWMEHSSAHPMRWLFWQRAELGLIKRSDKNQGFIKARSHSGSARPGSWNVSWKAASPALERCLSQPIRRPCCAGAPKGARLDKSRGSWQHSAFLLPPALFRAHWPVRVCPLYKSSARWRKGTQRLPGEQTRPIARAAAPLSFLRSPRSPFHSSLPAGFETRLGLYFLSSVSVHSASDLKAN